MNKSYYSIIRTGEKDSLKHWKYTHKEKKNGKWRYWYDDSWKKSTEDAIDNTQSSLDNGNFKKNSLLDKIGPDKAKAAVNFESTTTNTRFSSGHSQPKKTNALASTVAAAVQTQELLSNNTFLSKGKKFLKKIFGDNYNIHAGGETTIFSKNYKKK